MSIYDIHHGTCENKYKISSSSHWFYVWFYLKDSKIQRVSES